MKYFFEISGRYGAFATIIAYFLISFGALESTSLIYQLLNFTGAIGIAIISFHKSAYHSVLVNVVGY